MRIPGDKTGRVEGSMQLQQRDLGHYKIIHMQENTALE